MRNRTWVVLSVLLLAAGCAQNHEVQMVGTQKSDAKMPEMKPPAVPEQMSKLDVWLGTWSGTAEMVSPSPEEMKKMGTAGENMPTSMKGEQTIEKALGGMFLREEGWHEMGPGQRASYVTYTAWDGKAGKYRSWYFSDWGESGEGTMTPMADGKSWSMESHGTDGRGQKSKGTGTMKLVDENTMEWTWNETGSFGKMALKGTSKRQSK